MELMNTDAKGMAYIRSNEEFDSARRAAFIQDLITRISGHHMDLLCFEEVVQKLRLQDTVELGLQDVLLDQIAGSVGRYNDFTRSFLPRRAGRDKERWRQIYTLAVTGQGFPPIEVYKVDQVYFVKDGNHRVSVARKLNWKTIQAQVTDVPTVFTLTPDMAPDRLLIKEECAEFLEKTQLHKLTPEADITFTAPGYYVRLLKQIALHGYFMTKQTGRMPSKAEVVSDWYDNFYKPMIDHIRASGIMKHFPNRTADDLLAWVVDHQEALRLDHNMDEVGYTDDLAQILNHLNQLSLWEVTRVDMEDRIRGLLKMHSG